MLKSVEERLKSYEPLWENWTYTGEFLGEGAMSSVFEIESTAMGLREVAALKIITVKKDAYGDVKIPKTALNEIKILRALSGCPNIVNYHDSTQRKIYGEDKNLEEIDLLIKMEKLTPLSEGKKLSEKEVIKLAKDMCNALIYASKHGVIHRDIKPQNIFVDEDGIYKLGDFGISKIVSEFSHHYTMNIGTMAYTAPEICNGKSTTYDISSDIYSLGLVLYVFLNNGYLPFMNSTTSVNDAIAKRFSGAPFPSPASGSKALKNIVMRACSEETIKRYRKPEDMLEALELLSSDGKKLVVDPFATLDANIDVVDFMKTSYTAAPTVYDSVDSATRHTDSLSGGKKTGGLKINMGKKAAPSAASAPTPVSAPSPTPVVPPVPKMAEPSATAHMPASARPGEPAPRISEPAYPSGAPTAYMPVSSGAGSPATPPAAPRTGGLKIRMGTGSSTMPKPADKKEEKDEGAADLFLTPPSL